MTTKTDEIIERLQRCEADLEAHRGYLKAFEYALRATIITHPRPDDLARVWTQMLPGITKSHAQEGSPLFAAALHQALGLLAEQISEPHG